MTAGGQITQEATEAPDRPLTLELADGTCLVPAEDAKPSRVDGDRNHAFSLADVQREDAAAEPFAGYRRTSSS